MSKKPEEAKSPPSGDFPAKLQTEVLVSISIPNQDNGGSILIKSFPACCQEKKVHRSKHSLAKQPENSLYDAPFSFSLLEEYVFMTYEHDAYKSSHR